MHDDDSSEGKPFLTPNPRPGHSWSSWLAARRRKVFAICLIGLVIFPFLYLRSPSLYSLEETPTTRTPSAYTEAADIDILISQTTTVMITRTITESVMIPGPTETAYLEPPPTDPAVFLLIAWSQSAAAEVSLLIKTILMYTSMPVDFHIVCDDDARAYIEQRLSLVTHPTYDVHAHFYLPSWQSMLDRVEREGAIRTDHSAGLPGLMKLFLHEIVPPSITKGIFVDTDALFISDPALLWHVFTRLKSTTSIVMTSHPDQQSPEWYHASRICSCVMLLDLEKLRAVRLIDSSIYRNSLEDVSGYPDALSPPMFQKMYGAPEENESGKYENIRLGDQGYWWAIVQGRPDVFEPLSFDFEVTSCLMDSYLTGLGDDTITEEAEMKHQIHVEGTPQEGEVVLPELLHFNCLHDIYMDWEGWTDPDNSLNIRWGSAVEYHQGYKWIWLNKGKKLQTSLEIEVSRDVRFADEIFAEEHNISY